jgi:hypothetical protein
MTEKRTLLQTSTAEDFQSDRRAPLGLIGLEQSFHGEFHPHVAITAEALNPSG